MLLKFTEDAWADYCYWQTQDKKTLKRINMLIKDIQRDPFTGIGKEPWDAMTQKADQIYQLGNSSIAEQNFGRVPIKIETNEVY